MDRSAGLLRLGRRLDDRFRVLRYDRRGYGRSHDRGGPFDMATHASDLVDLLETTLPPGERATLFGHSYGGNVALAVADRRPDLVARVVVYECPLSWLDWWPASTAGAAAVSAGDPSAAAEAFMRRLVGDRRWEGLPAGVKAARRAEGPAMVAELADLRRAAPWDPSRVVAPVLAVVGERARPHHRRAMEFVATLLPDVTLAVVDGAGHVGPNTHPEAIARLVGGFPPDPAPEDPASRSVQG
jgi:pimeloyl-ACP methyl ester carboxylesterase